MLAEPVNINIMNIYMHKKVLITIIILSLLLPFVSFAGEFKIINDQLFYNTGTKEDLKEGWVWIIATNNEAYKYFVHENFVLTDIPTLDGNKLDKKGRLIIDGKIATASELTSDMYRETNWDSFNGSYHITELESTSHEIQKFGQFEWPVKVTEVDEGISITWNGLYKASEIFKMSDTVFSLESKEGNFIDVIDENNFRLVFSSGEEAKVIKN